MSGGSSSLITGVNIYIYKCSASQLCRQNLVEFFEKRRQLITKELMRFTKSTLLIEWDRVEVFRLDAEAGGDVASNVAEP